MLPFRRQGGRKHPQQEFLQLDTTNILFICGGSFSGLDDIIMRRKRGTGIGYGADVRTRAKYTAGEILKDLEQEDLLRFGLIPELVGRLPIVAPLDELDVRALERILVEPKNALVRQYQRLFAMENVELVFTDDALHAIAEQVQKRKTGARGLRSVMENILRDSMFELPESGVAKVTVNADVVDQGTPPYLMYASGAIAKELKKAG